MKFKYSLVALFSVSMLTINAQKVNTTSAAVAYKSAQKEMMYQKMDKSLELLEEAKELIDKSALHEDTKTDAKTFYYRSLIYMDYAQALAMTGDTVKAKEVMTEEYQEEMKSSFQKAMEYDKKDKYKSDLVEYVNGKAGMYFTMANSQYDLGTDAGYENAYMAYFGAAGLMQMVNVIDTNAFVNAAICAEKIKRYDYAVEAYKPLAKNGYKNGMGYYYLAFAYKQLEDTVNYKKAIDDGLEKFPSLKELIIESVNYNLAVGNKEAALEALERAIKADPNNKTVYFAAGSTFQDIMEGENVDDKTKEEFLAKAGSYYDKALELDANYLDAAYNKGAMYLNAGVDLSAKVNNLQLGDPQYDILKAKALEMYKKAIPALEKALELNADSKGIVRNLRILYGKVGDKENQAKMTELYKSMK